MTAFIGASLTATYTTADMTGAESGKVPGIGDRYVDNNGKEYRFVQYNGGAGGVAAVAGHMTFYYAVSGASAGQTTIVTSDATDSGGIGAGVLQAAPASGDYCWIQTRGEATLSVSLTSGADGNALTAGTGDSTLKVSGAVTDAVCAFAVDASAKVVFLTCP
ncbi:hypothetical protein PSQ19_06035 [Devosia algicola]|uniref:Uncharacterized protein n=1 Tax=Devosia algicola TaxID=3026418 RepID=A0ABY7YR00_9HYPH|nr:hypothetical protein [Devosia algicola]WDR03627.1 hypothetical protein PSQ19_06035 [Devosia algicola]